MSKTARSWAAPGRADDTLLKNPPIGAGQTSRLTGKGLIFRQNGSLVLQIPLWLMEFLKVVENWPNMLSFPALLGDNGPAGVNFYCDERFILSALIGAAQLRASGNF
jgi:hypothetical protein